MKRLKKLPIKEKFIGRLSGNKLLEMGGIGSRPRHRKSEITSSLFQRSGHLEKINRNFFLKTIDLFLRMWYYNNVRRGKTLGRGLENVSPTVVIGASR